MKPVHEFLGRRIAWTHRVVQAALDSRMRAAGGDFTTWKVLAHLVDGEQPSQRELAARMVIDPATLVRHLDRVEADGLVTRARDVRDRRVVRIGITPAGRALHKTLHRLAEQLDTELYDLLSPTEYDRMLKTLHRITEHFAADDQGAERSSAGRSPLERERERPEDQGAERSSAARSPLERERERPEEHEQELAR